MIYCDQSPAGVKLMILRVSDCVDGAIYASAVTQAFDYALKMGAAVIQVWTSSMCAAE